MRTSELTGAALDWAVAKCEGFRTENDYQYTDDKKFNGWWQCGPFHWQPLCNYSTDWAQGGPIIEREQIHIYPMLLGAWGAKPVVIGEKLTCGTTPLIAAMRCYVASKLGDVVEIPEELL